MGILKRLDWVGAATSSSGVALVYVPAAPSQSNRRLQLIILPAWLAYKTGDIGTHGIVPMSLQRSWSDLFLSLLSWYGRHGLRLIP